MNVDDTDVLDRTSIDRVITAGCHSLRELLRNASLDWAHWSTVILGLRGLRSLAFARAGTTNMRSQAYRDAISGLLQLRKYSVYDQLDRQTRSDCYHLMDRLEDIDAWYAAQVSTADKLRWRHPNTIVKHCPRQYLAGMRKHNQPKPGRKKPAVTVETERLKALVLMLIRRLARYEPDVLSLLDKVISPADDPSDPLDDLIAPEPDDDVAFDEHKTKKPVPAKSSKIKTMTNDMPNDMSE